MEGKRYHKFVFKDDEKGIRIEVNASNGNLFESLEETSGELIIRANNAYPKLPTVSAGEYAKVLSVYTDNDGNKAVVPQGWTVSGSPKENIIWGKDMGLVIYHIPEAKVSGINWQNPDAVSYLMRTYDQLVWTPVEPLKANGTLDGVSFTEKFGRRNFRNEEFSESEYHEPLTVELALQKESVDKYHGYYSTRYNISQDEETGKPRSIRGADPWTNIDYPTMHNIGATMFKSGTIITSHLMYGSEYDTREEWVIETKTKTLYEIATDSTKWGNYCNINGSPQKVVKTGSREEWCVNNIYDFTGNVDELTQEHNNGSYRVARGGICNDNGGDYPADYRNLVWPSFHSRSTCFRVTLCIK